MMARDGITDIAILARTDIYGEGFMVALIREHVARIAKCGAAQVGVVTILFDEGMDALAAAAVYALWGALADQPSAPVLLVNTAATEYWAPDAPGGRRCNFWVRAANASSQTVFSTVATGWAAADAGPSVLLNCSRLPVEIMADESYALALEIYPGAYAGFEADWWLLMHAPDGWYYFDAAGQWRASPDGRMAPAHQGPLGEMPAREIFSGTGAPPGVYAFYFGVDDRDGILDAANTWHGVNTLTVHGTVCRQARAAAENRMVFRGKSGLAKVR